MFIEIYTICNESSQRIYSVLPNHLLGLKDVYENFFLNEDKWRQVAK